MWRVFAEPVTYTYVYFHSVLQACNTGTHLIMMYLSSNCLNTGYVISNIYTYVFLRIIDSKTKDLDSIAIPTCVI